MKRYQENIRRIACSAGLFLGLGVVGCGSTSTTPAPSFAFVANTNSNAITAFQVDPISGTLSPVTQGTFATGTAPEFMAVDSGSKFLFVTNAKSNDISVFAIDAMNGMLTPVPGSPFSAGTLPKGIAVAPSANLVFVANNGSNDISVFNFDPVTGALSPVARSPFPGGTFPIGVITDVSGRFLYVTNTSLRRLSTTNAVSAFSIDQTTGALAPLPGSPFAAGTTPIGLVADPNDPFIYVADHAANVSSAADTISVFSVDSTDGSLRPVWSPAIRRPTCGPSCHSQPMHPLRVTIHPKAKFAYVTDVGSNSVSAFSLRHGTLAAATAPVATGLRPFGEAFDPTGSFLYVVNKGDNNVSGYFVDPTTGMLSPLRNSPFAAGSGPVGIVVVQRR
jgi:6-phosphogluconolactonase